jgi:hypothetical protein
MSDLKTFLTISQRLGYPNPTPDSLTIAKSIDYSLGYLIDDLIREIGQFKTDEFIEKTFSKLGAMSSPGIKIDLVDMGGGEGSYVYLIINSFDVGEGDEDYEEVWIHYTLGDSLLFEDGEERTLEDIWDDIDMGTMGEFEDFLDGIQNECREKIYKQTGISIHFDSQI